jgi:hypothetical protein
MTTLVTLYRVRIQISSGGMCTYAVIGEDVEEAIKKVRKHYSNVEGDAGPIGIREVVMIEEHIVKD